MPTPNRIVGKAGSITISGTNLAFNKWSPKVTRNMGDTTDSADYDPTSDLIHKSQRAASVQTELTVEGKWDLNTTTAGIIAMLYNGAGAVPVVLKLDATTVYGHGNFDITDFSSDHPVEDTVTWSATLKSNGIFTPGA
jgi:hypothetical protein